MARFTKKKLNAMLDEFDDIDALYDRESYLDYLASQVAENTSFADALREVDLAVGNADVIKVARSFKIDDAETTPSKKARKKNATPPVNMFAFDSDLPF